MRITEILRDDESVDHIARHGVDPAEAEEVLFARPFIQTARGPRKRRIYLARGQTAAGRYLLVVFRYVGGGFARVITARDLSPFERKGYHRRIR